MHLQSGLHTVNETWNCSSTMVLAGFVSRYDPNYTISELHLLQTIVKASTGHPSLFIMMFHPLLWFMILFITDPVFLSILCPITTRSHSQHQPLQCHQSSINSYCYSFFVRFPFLWNKLKFTTITSTKLNMYSSSSIS